MQQTGFSLVSNGAEVGVFGSIPEPFILPDGDTVHGIAASVPFQAGVFLPRYTVDNPAQWCSRTGESVSVQADKVVSTVTYSATPDQRPETISDRQFFQQLALQNVITQDEAVAAVSTGTLPQKLIDLVAGLPADQQFSANMLLKGATEFDRSHTMVDVLANGFGWTSAQTDDVWRAAWAL